MSRTASMVDSFILYYNDGTRIRASLIFDTLEDAQSYCLTNNPFGWHSLDQGKTYRFGQQQSGDPTQYTIEKVKRFYWNKEE